MRLISLLLLSVLLVAPPPSAAADEEISEKIQAEVKAERYAKVLEERYEEIHTYVVRPCIKVVAVHPIFPKLPTTQKEIEAEDQAVDLLYAAQRDDYDDLAEALMPLATYLEPNERKLFYRHALKTCVAISKQQEMNEEPLR